MTLDHSQEIFPDFLPLAFSYAGRIAGPLFLFCFAEGMQHTRSRKKLMLRLYIASLVTSVGNLLVSQYFLCDEYSMGNVLSTLFVIGIWICLWEKQYNSKIQKICVLGGMFIIQTVLGLGIIMAFIDNIEKNSLINLTATRMAALSGVIPNYICCESGIIWVALGLAFYAFRGEKKKQCFCIAVYSTLMLIIGIVSEGVSSESLLSLNYQWMAILTVPFLWIYNGERGKYHRQFYYGYYPIHLWVLYTIGCLMQ